MHGGAGLGVGSNNGLGVELVGQIDGSEDTAPVEDMSRFFSSDTVETVRWRRRKYGSWCSR